MIDFKEVLEEHLNELNKQFPSISFHVSNLDGHALYNYHAQDHNSCAIIAGLWQAAQSLVEKKEAILNIATSDTGYFISQNQSYIFSLSFKNIQNPGKLKFHYKNIIQTFSKSTHHQLIEKESNDFLFHNINDDEIDNLFVGMES